MVTTLLQQRLIVVYVHDLITTVVYGHDLITAAIVAYGHDC